MSEPSHYPCHGVHNALAPKGRASGELTVSDTHLSFTIGNKKIGLNFAGLEITIGGANDRLVFFNHSSQPGWSFYTSDRSVLKDPILKQHPHLQTSMRKARVTRARGWALLAGVIIFCITSPIVILSNMDIASRVLAERVPVKWEEKLGKLSYDQYSLQSEFMDKNESAALLAPLVAPLLESLPDKRFDYRFYISNDSDLNAFALPGGIVVINAGLILAADSAEEVLGVISHEITHVRQRHGIRNIISTMGTYAIISALVGDVSGVMAIVTSAAPILINQGYSRKFESESDKLGFDMMVRANIDPSGLARFFEKMLLKEKEMLEKIDDKESRQWIEAGLGFLSSHPATQDRIDTLKNRAEQHTDEYRDLSLQYAKLRESVSLFMTEHINERNERIEKDEDPIENDQPNNSKQESDNTDR